jgi:hypothetical protein
MGSLVAAEVGMGKAVRRGVRCHDLDVEAPAFECQRCDRCCVRRSARAVWVRDEVERAITETCRRDHVEGLRSLVGDAVVGGGGQ